MFSFFHKKGLHTYTDEALMQEVIAGNSQAFTLLYQRYSAVLYRYLLRLLYQDKGKAEDFLQDVFLKVLHHAHTFNPKYTVKTWLYTLATNLCRNEWRKNQYQQEFLAEYPAEEQDDFEVIEKIDTAIFANALENTLAELTDLEREIVLLRFHAELTIKEIAEITNLPEGTVKSKIFYLLKKIAKKLQTFKHII